MAPNARDLNNVDIAWPLFAAVSQNPGAGRGASGMRYWRARFESVLKGSIQP